MEKLNELVELAEKADAVANLMDSVNPHTILAIAESFREMKRRAEAAEANYLNEVDHAKQLKNNYRAIEAKLAELEKQEPVAVVARREPTLLWEWTKQGKSIDRPDGMHLYARPAPAINLAELVPAERNKWEGTDEEGYDIDYMEPSDIYQMGKDEGFNLCRAAILRKIEEAK